MYSTWFSSDSESLSSDLFTLFLQLLLHLQASMHTTDARLHKPRAMEQSPRQSQDMSSLHVVGIASSSINFGTKCPLSTCQPHVSGEGRSGFAMPAQYQTNAWYNARRIWRFMASLVGGSFDGSAFTWNNCAQREIIDWCCSGDLIQQHYGLLHKTDVGSKDKLVNVPCEQPRKQMRILD